MNLVVNGFKPSIMRYLQVVNKICYLHVPNF
jgi:hypothetical protein